MKCRYRVGRNTARLEDRTCNGLHTVTDTHKIAYIWSISNEGEFNDREEREREREREKPERVN